jgi:hypothetical protein
MRVARGAAIGAAEVFWLSLIAALVAWAVSPSANPSRRLTGSSPDCVFVGKGGVICNRSATAPKRIATEMSTRVSARAGEGVTPPAK